MEMMKIAHVEVTVVFNDGSYDQLIILKPVSIEQDSDGSFTIKGKRPSKPEDPRREKILRALTTDKVSIGAAVEQADRILAALDAKE